MTVYLSLLVSVVGALTYGISSTAKAQEIGRIAFAAGLLVFLFSFAHGLVHVPG